MGKYVMDYDWLWTNEPHNDGSPATVLVSISGDGAEKAVRSWLQKLAAESGGITGSGGWVAKLREAAEDRVVLALISGGEDVADGIYWATEEVGEVFARFELKWENLPRT